ncbi:hypothetical protein HPP92_000372 [Vanilla planifolia]|uniref:MSP domain-containing protein n=1 Tax=Vanilla planifolia TaxID=51239 RepID=A0A835RXC5_VANPL|nr:hypothetical protein HPP92_000372 [Vanilla planifolia]
MFLISKTSTYSSIGCDLEGKLLVIGLLPQIGPLFYCNDEMIRKSRAGRLGLAAGRRSLGCKIRVMGSELVVIEPRELKFTFELKKQSSCLIQLSNKSNEYVAFKVKTTSPKRYCVRPNIGVIPPGLTCDFTVTMQAQRSAPPDMQLKDKFLVQTTIVPFGSTNEDIMSSMFSKEGGRYIEECKLRVILVSPPHSPVLQPFNGALKQEPVIEAPILKQFSMPKEVPVSQEVPLFKGAFMSDKQFNPSHAMDVEDLKSKANEEELISRAGQIDNRVSEAKDIEDQSKRSNLEFGVSETKDVEDLKSKINSLESKLSEADKMITLLKEEKTVSMQERERFQQEIILLRRRAAAKAQAGFPPYFVVFIWVLGMALGYLWRP